MKRPFYYGTQYLDWEAANCGRCKKSTADPKGFDDIMCDIERALAIACVDDGEIADELAERMTIPEGHYNWKCGEWEPTEEWKAEWRRRHKKP